MNQYQKVAFHTLGCKLNFAETSTIARLFLDAGYARVNFEDRPDVFVINTCSVTEFADKKCAQLVRKALKINPDAFIALIGCYAQLKPEEIAAIHGVDLVLGANEKFDIVQYVEDTQKSGHARVENKNIKQVTDFIPSYSSKDRTRTFFKIQDGCDYFCTFCTIPLARGKSRNASIEKTVSEVREIANSGAKEVVLVGVNIGDFGQGGEEDFFGLIKELDKIDGIKRFRISSIEPNLLKDEIIDFTVRESNHFAPHFHIPLQVGNNDILKKMRRRYERELFAERVQKIKELNPDCCIGVDVIVGFPGETDEDFEISYEFIRDLNISYLHVFTYSERANTSAPKLGEKVPMEKRRDRSKRLHILSNKKSRAFYESQLGKIKTVLFEEEEDEGFMYGFTENYIKVKIPYNSAFVNQLIAVQLDSIDSDGNCCATILEPITA
jgi:threonylcarbamoyladenosine tRNA methylthiotransferase MtaB